MLVENVDFRHRQVLMITRSQTQKKPVRHVEQDPRWLKIVARDRRADGTFFYSVKSTGVYCRPSCGAKLPKPDNVAFHGTCLEAEAAGFRPCKRCKPNQLLDVDPHAQTIARICRFIESSGTLPKLDMLAEKAGMSAYHFHRVFKTITGVTPRAYAVAKRNGRLRAALASRGTITEAMYSAGFNSSGRFYEAAEGVLGMKPSSYRAGGASEQISFAVSKCSLGMILVAFSVKGVCAILLGDDREMLERELQRRFPRASLLAGGKNFKQLVATVVAFVETPQRGLNLPLDIRGTAFQQRVWQALRTVPAGATASYTEIAKRAGSPKSVRAVAGACAANALAVAIPCHRVIRSDGSLSGYRWGVKRKQALLKREARKL